MKERYIGSVRFFKNLIFLVVIVGITVPTVLAVRYHSALNESRANTEQLKKQCSTLQEETNNSASSEPGLSQFLTADPGADAPAYQTLYPDFYAPDPLTADESEDKTAFLTFDDGPSARTPEILATLKKQNVKATFFVVGKTDEKSLQAMKDIVSQGHTLGMHSYTHNYKLIYASVDAYLADMYKLFCLIRDTTGTTPEVFRMPGGSINGYDYRVYHEILTEMLRRGFVPCDWNLSSGDATGHTITKAEILRNVVGKADSVNRGFVLMHDAADKTATSAALSDMIDGLRGKGFTFQRLTGKVKPVLFNYTDYIG